MLDADFRSELPQPEAVEAAMGDLPSGAPGAGTSHALATAVRVQESAREKARERASERKEERELEYERERARSRAIPGSPRAPLGGSGLPMWNPADSPAADADGPARRARGKYGGKQEKLFGLISSYGDA